MWQSPFTWAQPFWKVSSMGAAILWHFQIIKIKNVWIWTWILQNSTKHWEDLVLSLFLHYWLLQKYEVKRNLKKSSAMCGFEPGMFRYEVRCFHTALHPRTVVGMAHCTKSISSRSNECRAYLTLSDLVDFKVDLVDFEVEMIYPNYKKHIFTIINPLLSK